MILHPAILSLIGSALLVAGLLLTSSWFAVRVLVGWDPSSPSERQLALERRTHLVSTLLRYALVFELASLFLFIATADAMSSLFTGAMCAAGSLYASSFGYWALLFQVLGFVLAALWLIVNHADLLAHDYPLTRFKFGLLLVLSPVLLLELGLRVAYFVDLRPEVITSCCGSLFSRAGQGLGSRMVQVPAAAAGGAFACVALGTAGSAAWFRGSGRGGWAFGALASLLLPAGLLAVVSWLSPYVYDLPTHHCPFCVLRGEYHWIGYALYGALFGGSLAGAGVGLLMRFRSTPSLAGTLPDYQRTLANWSLGLLGLLGALIAGILATSHLRP